MQKHRYSFLFLFFVCLSFSATVKDKDSTEQSRTIKPHSQLLAPGYNNVTTWEEFNTKWGTPTVDQRHLDSGVIPYTPDPRHREESIMRDCSGGDCWALNHVGDDTQWYLGSGSTGDTFLVAFQPILPCIVQEVYVKWNDAGTVTAFGAILSDSAYVHTDGTGASVNFDEGIVFGRGDYPFSPIGTMMTEPTVNEIEGVVQDWSAQLDIGGSFQVGDENNLANVPPFVIGFVKNDDSPHPLAADVALGGTGMSYNWFGGPWTTDESWGEGYVWGNYQTDESLQGDVIDIAVMAMVQYPWDLDWVYVDFTTIPNTFNTSGSKLIEAHIMRNVLMYPNIDDVSLQFKWALNGALQEIQTIEDAVPIDIGDNGNGVYGFEIEYSTAPDSQINCWVEIETIFGILLQWSGPDFDILEPENPNADLLIIADSDHSHYADQYELFAGSYGMVYEYWRTAENNGIDASVINWGWNNILVYGWGNATLPVLAEEEDPGYGEFLDNGGNLILIDQDWFYGHGLPGDPVQLEFLPGDPAYDWFGLAGGISDPDYQNESGWGDTTIIALQDGLSDLTLNYAIYGIQNRTDFLFPAQAIPIYEGGLSEQVMGTAYEHPANGSKTINLAFTADAAVDTLEDGSMVIQDGFIDLLEYTLNWFMEEFVCPAWDFNCDESVDVLDLVILVSCILETGDCDESMDANQDANINILDIVMIVDWIMST